MIFVTIGTQLPFDRLIGAVDRWACLRERDDVFAQVGPSRLQLRRLRCAAFIDNAEYQRRIEQSSAVVAHAGMGTILNALELGKPVVVMPRLAAQGEHRNDHQLATVRRLDRFELVHPVYTEEQLCDVLDALPAATNRPAIDASAPAPLIAALRSFVFGEEDKRWPLAA